MSRTKRSVKYRELKAANAAHDNISELNSIPARRMKTVCSVGNVALVYSEEVGRYFIYVGDCCISQRENYLADTIWVFLDNLPKTADYYFCGMFIMITYQDQTIRLRDR